MTSLPLIAQRVLNRPLLVTPDMAEIALSVLAGRIGIGTPEASRFEGERVERDASGRPVAVKPYNVSNGVAIITITGSLVNRGAWLGANCGLTSYEGIQHQLKSAAADPAVHSVILDLHSPGGEAVGAFETAAMVRSLAGSRRVVAVVNGMAASAAYAIASGANEIVTTETGVSGSIGVVLLHADFSRQLDREGISPTLIHAGAHKVDGNPFEPLSQDVRQGLQAEVDAFYDSFLETVAKGRGNRLNAAAARKTEARTFIGKAAVSAGTADRVGSFESVLAELSRAGGRKPVQTRSTSMDILDNPAAAAGTVSQADHDRAVAAARAEGVKAGATAERGRFTAVISSEHFAGREKPAHTMLTTTDMTAEAVTAVLANLPSTEPAKAEAPASAPAASPAQSRGPLGVSTIEVPGAQKAAGNSVNTAEIYGSRRKATVG